MTSATQADLRYNQISETTSKRWQAVLKSNRLTERACRLIALALASCEAAGPAGMQTKLFRGCLWIKCEQERLAELLECSDRSIRREFQRLETLGVLKRVAHEDLENVVAWVLSLERLEALPESDTPELDELIYGCPDPFQVDAEFDPQPATCNPQPATLSAPLSGGLSAPVSTGLSGGLSAPVSTGLSGLMNHEGLNENINSSITHDHEAGTKTLTVRFDQISAKHIRAIAGFTVEANGRSGILTEPKRMAKVREYFDDALAAGLALPDECQSFVALFRNVGRRTDVKHRERYLRTLWTNRHERPLEGVLTPSDRGYARQLLAHDSQHQPHTPFVGVEAETRKRPGEVD